MKVLVNYAHPNPNSFNHAVLESFTKGLKESEHTFRVNDLYANNFDPCFKLGDFAQFTGGQLPKIIMDEQEKVSQADALVFIYPIWDWGCPAILKGWQERVFSNGFAYQFSEKGGLVGILKHKKVLIICSTMGPEEFYDKSGIADAIKIIDKATYTGVCGIKNVEHVFLYGTSVSEDARKKYLDDVYRLGKKF